MWGFLRDSKTFWVIWTISLDQALSDCFVAEMFTSGYGLKQIETHLPPCPPDFTRPHQNSEQRLIARRHSSAKKLRLSTTTLLPPSPNSSALTLILRPPHIMPPVSIPSQIRWFDMARCGRDGPWPRYYPDGRVPNEAHHPPRPAFLKYHPTIHPIPCKSGYPLLQTKLASLSDGTLEHDHLGDPGPLPEEAFEVARTGLHTNTDHPGLAPGLAPPTASRWEQDPEAFTTSENALRRDGTQVGIGK